MGLKTLFLTEFSVLLALFIGGLVLGTFKIILSSIYFNCNFFVASQGIYIILGSPGGAYTGETAFVDAEYILK